jgi:hypothetical protein
MLAMVYSGFRSLSPAGLLIKGVELGDDCILITGGAAPLREYVRIAGGHPSACKAVKRASSWTRPHTVVRFSCGSRFADFVARNRVADGAFLPSRSARRSRGDWLGVPLGSRRSSTISAFPWAVDPRRRFSKDIFLRVVRRRATCSTSPLQVIGIGDWAWKRGQRYGSVMCDLEQRRIVALLPDREPARVEAWLSRHPKIVVISRDRGGGYGRTATRAAPGPAGR